MSTLIVGCGYLGRRVARRLADRGERVFGTTRTPARTSELAEAGAEAIVADVLDIASLRALPEVGRVLHCVGLDRSSGVSMRAVYVEGLRNVLEALRGRAKTVVLASSTSVHGGLDGGWVTEETPAEPLSESGRVCLEAEETLLAESSRLGFEARIVRFSGLYGPGRVVGRDALSRSEAIAGDPERHLNLIHIDDAAAAAVLALGSGGVGRVYLASDDRPVRRREYYERAAALLGAPPPRFEGSPAARDEPDRRIANRRIKAELGLILAFPDIALGLPDALGTERTGVQSDGAGSM